MYEVQDSLDIKFCLIDGSDIGLKSYPAAAATTATVATLKAFFLNDLKYCYCIRILYNLLASLLFVTRLKLRIVTGSDTRR
ncbi:hypothetical protein Tco_0901706 [Tanacetum coccineum]